MHVTFDSNPPIIHYYPLKWEHSYQEARKDIWMEAARDHDRFQRHINNISKILEPILKKHLLKINQSRFM